MIDVDTSADVPTTGQSPQRRRWWMSWSLWLVLLAASLLVIAAVSLYSPYRRLRAFEYLDANGIAYTLSDSNEWMTDRFGEHAKGFREVTAISVNRPPSDSVLLQMAEFKEADELGWFHAGEQSRIGEQGIQALQELSHLHRLFLIRVRYKNDVLTRWLTNPSPRLRHIEFGQSEVSREVLFAVAKVPTIEQLHIWESKVADEAFIDLPPMKRLSRIALAMTEAGDHAAAWISQCSRLEDVDLSEISITDDGLREIAQLSGLRVLSLSHCPHITDAGVVSLGSLTRLESLSLPSQAITAESVESLSKIPTLSEVLVTGTIDDPMLREQMSDLWDYREVHEGSPFAN